MRISYEVHLYSNTGVLLKTLTKRITRLEWERKVNDVGSFALTLSDRFKPVDTSLFQLNGRVMIYRKAAAFEMPKLECAGFIRDWDFATDEKGVTRYTWRGPDQNDLLASRACYVYHPYTGGFWHPYHVGYADNLMRELTEDNLGAGSSNATERDVVTSNPAGMTIGIESSASTTVCTDLLTVDHGGKGLLQVLQEISSASKTAGTTPVPCYFDMALDSDTAWTFRVYSPRRGMNHRSDSGQALQIGLPYGNLVEPRWSHDRRQEANAVLLVNITEASGGFSLDSTRIGQAPLNRREVATFGNAAALLDEGNKKAVFSGRIMDTPQCRYGVHWGLGDELTVDYLGQQYNVMVTGLDVECYSGRERLVPTFEVMDT